MSYNFYIIKPSCLRCTMTIVRYIKNRFGVFSLVWGILVSACDQLLKVYSFYFIISDLSKLSNKLYNNFFSWVLIWTSFWNYSHPQSLSILELFSQFIGTWNSFHSVLLLKLQMNMFLIAMRWSSICLNSK